MELWIRSQDRELLVLAKGFEFQYTSYDGGYQIFAVWQNNYQMVGKYKNKERALEVLDEIHQRLIDLQTIEIAPDSYKTIKRNINCVYEMPKE